jgi:hypothetical protein
LENGIEMMNIQQYATIFNLLLQEGKFLLLLTNFPRIAQAFCSAVKQTYAVTFVTMLWSQGTSSVAIFRTELSDLVVQN